MAANKKVNLFILGYAKCGTSTLANMLNKHTQVYIPKGKEVHYFDDEERYAKGEYFYHSKFDNFIHDIKYYR